MAGEDLARGDQGTEGQHCNQTDRCNRHTAGLVLTTAAVFLALEGRSAHTDSLETQTGAAPQRMEDSAVEVAWSQTCSSGSRLVDH